MATLHFICGKAGTGKRTLARALGRTLPAAVFCEDEWLVTLGFEIRSLADFEAAAAKCRALIGPLAADLLRLGVSVVFDFAGNTVESRRWVRTLFEAAAADHLLHVGDRCPVPRQHPSAESRAAARHLLGARLRRDLPSRHGLFHAAAARGGLPDSPGDAAGYLVRCGVGSGRRLAFRPRPLSVRAGSESGAPTHCRAVGREWP
jgi:predicted kinase